MSRKCTKYIFTFLFDSEKAYTLKKHLKNHIPQGKLRRVLQEHSVDGHMLLAISSEVFVNATSIMSQSFALSVGLRQRYIVLSPLLSVSVVLNFCCMYRKWYTRAFQVVRKQLRRHVRSLVSVKFMESICTTVANYKFLRDSASPCN